MRNEDCTKLFKEESVLYGGKEKNFRVRVDISNLNIRRGPGTHYAKTGEYTGKGVFTIVEESYGLGSQKGWGRLKSGKGWIALDYAERI